MADSIVFLGTGGDPAVVGKQMRASGGIALFLEGNQFILDPGPGCLVRAKEAGINIRDTIAVIASHGHTNHASDLNAVVEALTLLGLDRMGVVVAPKSVISGDEAHNPVLAKRSAGFVERAIEIEPGKKISINNVNMRFIKAAHFDTDSVGMVFETQRYRIGYTADTDYSDELPEEFKNCDLLIINCKNPFGVKEKGHLNSEEVVSLLRRAKPGRAVITHFSIKMLQAGPLNEARSIQREAKVEVVAATDGLELAVSSFRQSLQA
jgi:ribonuclease BN (tRNA processing enzyme)